MKLMLIKVLLFTQLQYEQADMYDYVNKKGSIYSAQSGLSLVELMIAMALGLFLLAGVMQVFLSSKNVYGSQKALSRVQESGRLAMEFISRDIRMAGYMGCASRAGLKIKNTLNTPNGYLYNFAAAVNGYTDSTLPGGHPISPAPTTSTDVLVLRGASGSGVQVIQVNDATSVFVGNVSNETNACTDNSDRISGLCLKDIVAVTDCAKARVFQVSKITPSGSGPTAVVKLEHDSSVTSPGNALTSWGAPTAPEAEIFKPGSEVMTANTTTYFIATGVSGRPSLWQNLNGTNVELLEGVENLSIKYGFIDGTYSYASAVAGVKWEEVVSVRIEVVVASTENNVLPETQKYTFKGVLTTPTDKRLRQVFTSTVGIRSRLN